MIAYTCDLAGNITSFSKGAERVTGYSRDEAVRMNIRDIVAPDYQEVLRRMLNPDFVSEGIHTFGLEIVTKNGQRVAMQIASRVIRRQGRTVGVQGIARQVYEAKGREAEEPPESPRAKGAVEPEARPRGEREDSPALQESLRRETAKRAEAEQALAKARSEVDLLTRRFTEELSQAQASIAAEIDRRERIERALEESKSRLAASDQRHAEELGSLREALGIEITRRERTESDLERARSEGDARDRQRSEELSAIHAVLSAETERREAVEAAFEKVRSELDAQSVRHSEELTRLRVSLAEEVSRREQAEQALEQSQDEFEFRLGRQTEEISKANAILQSQIAEHERVEESLRKAQEDLEVWYAERMADLSKANASLKADLAERETAVQQLQRSRDELQTRLDRQEGEYSKANDILEEESRRRRQAEEELQQAQSELKHRLEELRSEIMKANTILEEEIVRRRRAEEALQDREDQYRKLLESANDLVFNLDTDGNFTSINLAVERLTDSSRDEALNMNLSQLVTPDCQDLVHRMIQRQLLDQSPLTFEIAVIDREGTRRILEVNTQPLYRYGSPEGLQGIARDITERRKMEETLRRANLKLDFWVKETEQRIREMTLLSELGDLLRACVTMEEAYAVIIPIAEQLFQLDTGALCLTASRQKLVETVAVWGSPRPGAPVFNWDDCWALRRGRVHQVDDTRLGLLCKHLDKIPPAAYLCVPIIAHGEALGVLHLRQQETWRLTETKRRLVVTVSEHLGLALSYLKLHHELRVQLIRDPLTGLFNYKFMEESLELALRRAERNQSPLAVIRVAVDHLEAFEEQFGPDAGDALLRTVAEFLRSNIRGADIACRDSGGEFTLIMPEGSLDVIRLRAEHLRSSLRHLPVSHRNQSLPPATVSLGLAIFPEHGSSSKELLESANAALKRAATEGGDRVQIAL